MKYILLTISVLFIWTRSFAQLVDDTSADASCVKMQMAISSTLLKMASTENYYTISYCNHGTATASNATIELTLDPHLIILNSEKIILSQVNNIYLLDVGDVEEGLCASFEIQVSLSSSATMNQVHCTNARIQYDNSTCNDTNTGNASATSTQHTTLGRVIVGPIGMPNGPGINFVFEDDVMLNQTPLDLDTLMIIAASLSTDVGTVINTIEQQQR